MVTDVQNTIIGNYIGTDVTGTRAVSNTLVGVYVQGCSNVIGGVTAGSGNVISGNGQEGVELVGTSGNVTGNVVQGNWIGLDATGTNSLGNGNAGVAISSAAANQIGGAAPGARNVISGNGNNGMVLPAPARPAMSFKATTSAPTRPAVWHRAIVKTASCFKVSTTTRLAAPHPARET